MCVLTYITRQYPLLIKIFIMLTASHLLPFDPHKNTFKHGEKTVSPILCSAYNYYY